MARNGESVGVPEAFRALANVKAVGRVPQTGMLQVEVKPVTTELRQLVSLVHADISYGVSVSEGVMTVSEEDLLRYVVTALRTRVAHVNRERFHLRVQEPWALPHVFNYIVSAVGRVELDMITVVPVWNAEADALVMSYEEQVQTTQRLRALKFRGYDFARALSAERLGHVQVMTLVHIDDEWASRDVFTLSDAIVASAVGVDPVVSRDGLISSHPLYVPTYKIRDVEVVRHLPRLGDVKVSRGATAS